MIERSPLLVARTGVEPYDAARLSIKPCMNETSSEYDLYIRPITMTGNSIIRYEDLGRYNAQCADGHIDWQH